VRESSAVGFNYAESDASASPLLLQLEKLVQVAEQNLRAEVRAAEQRLEAAMNATEQRLATLIKETIERLCSPEAIATAATAVATAATSLIATTAEDPSSAVGVSSAFIDIDVADAGDHASSGSSEAIQEGHTTISPSGLEIDWKDDEVTFEKVLSSQEWAQKSVMLVHGMLKGETISELGFQRNENLIEDETPFFRVSMQPKGRPSKNPPLFYNMAKTFQWKEIIRKSSEWKGLPSSDDSFAIGARGIEMDDNSPGYQLLFEKLPKRVRWDNGWLSLMPPIFGMNTPWWIVKEAGYRWVPFLSSLYLPVFPLMRIGTTTGSGRTSKT
jgi:hypothetical protein